MQAPFPDNGVRRKKLRSNRSNYAVLVSAAAAGFELGRRAGYGRNRHNPGIGIIAEAIGPRLSPAERGHLVRALARQLHEHPDGRQRQYSRGTLDRWIRAY